jgi:hypothetical protein
MLRLRSEVVCFEHLSNLDLRLGSRHRIRAALDPLDRFFLRFHLQQPEPGDKLFRLGERASLFAFTIAMNRICRLRRFSGFFQALPGTVHWAGRPF